MSSSLQNKKNVFNTITNPTKFQEAVDAGKIAEGKAVQARKSIDVDPIGS